MGLINVPILTTQGMMIVCGVWTLLNFIYWCFLKYWERMATKEGQEWLTIKIWRGVEEPWVISVCFNIVFIASTVTTCLTLCD